MSAASLLAAMEARSDWASQADIAEALGISQQRVAAILRKAGMRLQGGTVVILSRNDPKPNLAELVESVRVPRNATPRPAVTTADFGAENPSQASLRAEALREAGERYRMAIMGTPDGVRATEKMALAYLADRAGIERRFAEERVIADAPDKSWRTGGRAEYEPVMYEAWWAE